MPLRKLRALPDLDETLAVDADDPELWGTIRQLWALSRRLCRADFPPGVHKRRSIEEANEACARWEAAAVARHRRH